MIPPLPHAAFAWQSGSPRGPLVCLPLDRHARHLFSTRAWRLGTSQSAVDDEDGWAEIADAMGVEPRALGRVRQVHGNVLVVAGRGRAAGRADGAGQPGDPVEARRHDRATPLADADIVITDDPDCAVAVQGADCVPLLAVDVVRGAVAAAHAGWRGMTARVPMTMVQGLVEHYGSRPEDLVVAAGPSIGACCYQVGPDVRSAFLESGYTAAELDRSFLARPLDTPVNPSMPSVDRGPRGDRWFLDLWRILRDQLGAAGVREDRIFTAELCTASHPEFLCSFRRDGRGAGRLVGAIRPSQGRVSG